MDMALSSRYLTIVSSAVLIVLAGCAAPRSSRAIMPFAAPSRPLAPSVTFTDPPSLPNLYLSHDAPDTVLARMVPPPTPSDLLIVKADEAYQRGKALYQAGDKERAR